MSFHDLLEISLALGYATLVCYHDDDEHLIALVDLSAKEAETNSVACLLAAVMRGSYESLL